MDEVRGYNPGRGDPPPLDGFEEPAEHVADPGGAARSGDGEESLGEGASLGAAEPAPASQGIHLVRESLEMRVKHLRGSMITRGGGRGQRLRDDGKEGSIRSGPVWSGLGEVWGKRRSADVRAGAGPSGGRRASELPEVSPQLGCVFVIAP